MYLPSGEKITRVVAMLRKHMLGVMLLFLCSLLPSLSFFSLLYLFFFLFFISLSLSSLSLSRFLFFLSYLPLLLFFSVLFFFYFPLSNLCCEFVFVLFSITVILPMQYLIIKGFILSYFIIFCSHTHVMIGSSWLLEFCNISNP